MKSTKKNIATILSSTDMSKAFDSLCHNLSKSYGLTGQSLDLIPPFLNDRYSRVKLGSIKSEWSKMSWMSSRIFIWPPLTWNLFQSNMTSLVKDANLFMYADDHLLYATGSNHNIVSSTLQDQGKLAMPWYRDNYLLSCQHREVPMPYC